MSKYLLLLLVAFLPMAAEAQILNIEQFRLSKDTSKYFTGNVSFGADITKQATVVSSYDGAVNMVYLSEKHSYMTLNYYKLIKSGKGNLISEGYTHWRMNLFRRKFVSCEPFVQMQYNLGRGLYRRGLAGATARFDIKSHNKIEIAINTGFMYENELWRGNVIRFVEDSDTTAAVTHFIKSTTSLSIRAKLADHLTLFSVFYYQARPDYFLKPRLIADFQLLFTISKLFSFSVEYKMATDALPVTPINNYVYNLDMNLVMKFK